MMKKTDTLYNIVIRYPEVKDFLISQGLTQVQDQQMLEKVGKNLTLEILAKSKKMNVELFLEELESVINDQRKGTDTTLIENERKTDATIDIQGILPCPVRIPLLEGFEAWLEGQEDTYKNDINYELKAASMGVDWIKEKLENSPHEDELADVFLSAGFDLFFDKKLMGHYKAEKVFEDLTRWDGYNSDFDNASYSLKDPDGDYSVLGVVPAIFLINTHALGEREIPKTWADLLTGAFDNQVSLPVGDFDLFNAILLNIYKNYGIDGVKKLGKTLMKSMHPAEMVKSNTKQEQPLVTIMPYFFTKMVHERSPMKAIWPEDGAIISPIFMLSKKSKKDSLQAIVDFFASKEVGEILSHNGRFPSVHPQVDNRIALENTYQWLGWDFIQAHDIGELIDECMHAFNGGA
jgi:ABC-type Fe3+ transport system substrate-binding protein